MALAGDLGELSIQSSLGTKRFKIKSKEDWEKDSGGKRIEDEEDGITTDGTAVFSFSTQRWTITLDVLNELYSDNKETTDYLQQLMIVQDTPICMVTHGDGIRTYTGTGRPVGQIKTGRDGFIKLKLSGGGVFAKL